jgi:nicotinamidase/pyrazinamidase
MDLTKAVFWNTDTQYDFIDKDGKLSVENAESIKPNLKKLTDFARVNNIKVVNTMDWHFKDSKELSDDPDFVKTFPPHCMANTEGARFIDETSPDRGTTMLVDWSEQKGMNFHDIHKSRNIIIRKDAFDVFEGNNLTEAIVNNLGIPFLDRPTFIVYGVATNVCVKAAVEGLTKRGYSVKVVTDAIKGLPTLPDPTSDWSNNEMIELVTTEQVTQLQTV